jgi:glycosyltransferase involved in cell wall biosynthesis
MAAPPRKPRPLSLGVCIPVWNRGRLFQVCFDALVRNLAGLEATIWLFDNGSDAETRRIVADLSCAEHRLHKVFLPENMGVPYVANLFAQAIRESCDFTGYSAPQYALIMDADAYWKKPILGLVQILHGAYTIGLLSGHDSIEHAAVSETVLRLNGGRSVRIKEKRSERMLTMLTRAEEFAFCHPFPHYRNMNVDWEITQWHPNSMMKRRRRICVACDYAVHLGLDSSTWNNELASKTSDAEREEVAEILKRHQL